MAEFLRQAHGYVIGFSVIGAWFAVMLWALVLRLARREGGRWFWRGVSVAQILLVVQLLVGLVLLALGRRPGPEGGAFTMGFHIAYGFGFPLVVLLVAHKWARDERYHSLTVFAFAAFIIVGLTVRGWFVGIQGA
jgi:hypothetical protein